AAGRHAEALAAASRAGAMKMTASLRRFLAEELVALGRFPAAYEAAQRCNDEAPQEPPSPNHDLVVRGCRELVRDLAGKVAVVSIDWGGDPPAGATVALSSGESLDLAVPVHPLAPGSVELRASAPGFRDAVRTLDLIAGSVHVVSLRLEAIAPPEPPRPPLAPARPARVAPRATALSALGSSRAA